MSSTKESEWPREPVKLIASFLNRQLSIPTTHLSASERRNLASLLLEYGFRPKTVQGFTSLSPKILSTLRAKCSLTESFSTSDHRRRPTFRRIRQSDHDYLLWRYFRWDGPWLPFLRGLQDETGIRIDELLAFYMFMVNAKRYELRDCPACADLAPLRPRSHGCPACLKSGKAAHRSRRKQAIASSPFFL